MKEEVISFYWKKAGNELKQEDQEIAGSYIEDYF